MSGGIPKREGEGWVILGSSEVDSPSRRRLEAAKNIAQVVVDIEPFLRESVGENFLPSEAVRSALLEGLPKYRHIFEDKDSHNEVMNYAARANIIDPEAFRAGVIMIARGKPVSSTTIAQRKKYMPVQAKIYPS